MISLTDPNLLTHITGRKNKNPSTQPWWKHVPPLPKHSGKRVFPLADTWRFFMFPSLRLQRKRNTFLYVSDRFPFQESRTSATVNVCFCCGNAKFRNGNLFFRSFFWQKREDTVRQPDWFFRNSVRFCCRYCVNSICPKSFIFAETKFSGWNFS